MFKHIQWKWFIVGVVIGLWFITAVLRDVNRQNDLRSADCEKFRLMAVSEMPVRCLSHYTDQQIQIMAPNGCPIVDHKEVDCE